MKWLPLLTVSLLAAVGLLLAERFGAITLPLGTADGSGEVAACANGDMLCGANEAAAGTPAYVPANQIGLAEATDSIPDSPAGAGLVRGLRWLNLGVDAIADAEFQGSLAPSVLERTPLVDLRRGFGQVASIGPFAVVGYLEAPTPTSIKAVALAHNRQYVQIVADVEPTPPHRITVFHVTPWTPTAVNPAANYVPAAPAFAAPAAPALAEGSGAAVAPAAPTGN